jgi:streptogramin lyase
VGPDGGVWFTAVDYARGHFAGGEPVDDAIVRMTPSGQFTVFPLPHPGVLPDGITVGPDGNVWFTEYYGNAVGRITPDGVITEFHVPTHYNGGTPQSQPHEIVAGPDGNLWFPDSGGGKIGRISPGGALVEYALPSHPEVPYPIQPYSIAAGPDGNLWFTENTALGRITPAGAITEFPLPAKDTGPYEITAGPDGDLWFLEEHFEANQDTYQIGRITPAGVITEFPLSYASEHPQALIAGPGGALWYAVPHPNTLGSLALSGAIAELHLPTERPFVGGPATLALGHDSTLWCANSAWIWHISAL